MANNKKKAFKGLVSSPLIGYSVTMFRVIPRNKMFLEGKIKDNLQQLQWLTVQKRPLFAKMFQFEKVNSFHTKPVVSYVNC